MKAVIALVIALLGVASAAQLRGVSPNGAISYCSGSSAHAKNLKFAIDPAEPKAGEKYTLTADYDLDETVTGGTIEYIGTINGFPVFDTTDDLCTDLAKGDTPCPLKEGHIHSVSSNDIPSGLPSGTLLLKTIWKDQNGEEIMCFGITVNN